MSAREKQSSKTVVSDIRRKTHRKYSVEEMIRIILKGFKSEIGFAELCLREGIVGNL